MMKLLYSLPPLEAYLLACTQVGKGYLYGADSERRGNIAVYRESNGNEHRERANAKPQPVQLHRR